MKGWSDRILQVYFLWILLFVPLVVLFIAGEYSYISDKFANKILLGLGIGYIILAFFGRFIDVLLKLFFHIRRWQIVMVLIAEAIIFVFSQRIYGSFDLIVNISSYLLSGIIFIVTLGGCIWQQSE